MPLPPDATLTLQGQPRPGDPLHSKPKQAMLFRMSAETFEQLEDAQNLPRLQFEFGKNPGLYINDTFYPVRADPENGPHELYLRMASAQKPMAPLKMYANVIGKFAVDRQLGEKVESSVRDRTLEAEKQRTERKAIYLDAPPDLSYPGAKGKGRKDATAPRRPAVASASRPPSAIRTSRVASPLPASSSHASASANANDVSSARARLIHCLALKPRTSEQIVVLCGGKDPSPQTKKELLAQLHSVAEPKPIAKSSESDTPHWQLKLQSWREVRPYAWPTLEPNERTAMARQQRTAFSNLKIPESDSVWEHARYRGVGDAGPSAKAAAGPSASAAEAKKGMLSKATTKRAKPAEGARKKVSDIIIAKDESARPARDDFAGKGKARERERDMDEGSGAGTPTSATRPPNRRLPGSGYKVKASATPPATELRANSPLPPPPKRTGPVDARESKRERDLPAPSGSARPLPPIAAPAASPQPKVPQFRKKTKDATERAAEDRREERQRERERQAAADERQRSKGQGSPVPIKRKKPLRDGDDSEYSERDTPLRNGETKRRRLDEQPAAAERPRGRDLSLPKKPTLREPSPLGPPRTKVKKEPSPLSIAFSPPPTAARSSLPPRPSMPENAQPPPSSSSSSASKEDAPHRASSTVKRRRGSIDFTSSEESDPPPREPVAKKLKTKAKAKHAVHFKARSTLPADRAGLRSYYKACFLVYIRLYQEQAQLRDRIEHLLGRGSDGEISGDDDDDVADLDPEVLKAFMAELQAVTDEMNKIKEAWENLGGSVDSSGELVDE